MNYKKKYLKYKLKYLNVKKMYGGVEDSSDKDKLMEEKRQTLKQEINIIIAQIEELEGQRGNCESDLEDQTGNPDFTGEPNEYDADDVFRFNENIKQKEKELQEKEKELQEIEEQIDNIKRILEL